MAIEKRFEFKIYLNKTNSYGKPMKEIKQAELVKGVK